MKKKYKLLIHLGLPKTATTSLQHNVFLRLHEEGVINYLGVAEIDNKIIHYPINAIIKELPKRRLTNIEANKLRENLVPSLESEKINILSDENFSHSLLCDLDVLYFNLNTLFQFCEITCVISLRSPVDYMFSLYVQMNWKFHYDKRFDNFEKFSAGVMSDPESKKYTEFFYDRYLNLVDRFFNKKIVLLYEDLIHDSEYYFEILSKVTGVEKSKIQKYFLDKRLNEKKIHREGKYSQPPNFKMYLSHRLNWLKLPFFRRSYFLRLVYRNLQKMAKYIPFGDEKLHVYPEHVRENELFELLKVKDVKLFSDKHSLDVNKLILYKYGK